MPIKINDFNMIEVEVDGQKVLIRHSPSDDPDAMKAKFSFDGQSWLPCAPVFKALYAFASKYPVPFSMEETTSEAAGGQPSPKDDFKEIGL